MPASAATAQKTASPLTHYTSPFVLELVGRAAGQPSQFQLNELATLPHTYLFYSNPALATRWSFGDLGPEATAYPLSSASRLLLDDTSSKGFHFTMAKSGRVASAQDRKEAKERERKAYERLRPTFQRDLVNQSVPVERPVPASHNAIPRERQQKRVRFSTGTVATQTASHPPANEPDNEVVTAARTHVDTLSAEHHQQHGPTDVRTSTEAGHQRRQTITTTSRDVLYIQNVGTVNLQTRNLHTESTLVDPPHPPPSPNPASSPLPSRRISIWAFRNYCQALKAMAILIVVAAVYYVVAMGWAAVCSVLAAGWTVVRPISTPFFQMYHLAEQGVRWILPSAVLLESPVVAVADPPSAFAPSPMVADLDAVLGVLARTEYSMRALSEISPSMHHNGKLSEAVKSLTQIHRATNLDWAEQLQVEHRTLSHFILKLRDIAEDVGPQRKSPWWMKIPRSVCHVPVLGDTITPCRMTRNQLVAQLENMTRFMSETTSYRKMTLMRQMSHSASQGIRNNVCGLGHSLDETRAYFMEETSGTDETAGENALSIRIGAHINEYRSGLDLSCEVVKYSVSGFSQTRDGLEEDLRMMKNANMLLGETKDGVMDQTISLERAIERARGELEKLLRKVESW